MRTKEIFFLFCLLLINSCKESPTDPPTEKEEIVTQIDIPWLSLADTPWPMNHHDPQSTGRSKYAGPSIGVVENKIEIYGIEGSIVLDESNNFYLTDNYPPQSVYAFSLEGEPLWVNEYIGPNASSTPLIGKDSTIYVCMGRTLFAYNYDGTVKWQYLNDIEIYNIGINIDLAGNIYFIDESHKLNVIDQSGNLLWQLYDSRFRSDVHGAPTFSPDSKYLYVQGITESVLAVNVNTHEVEWTFGSTKLESSTVIDNNGNLYFAPEREVGEAMRTLYSLNASGEINWEYRYSGYYQLDNTEPTIDYNGNIYFGNDTLYSVSNSGKLRWKRYQNGNKIATSLLSDSDDNIYFGATGSGENGRRSFIISFDNHGEQRWELEINEIDFGFPNIPVLTNNGRLICPSYRTWNILIIN
jgi:hypothetical protein